MEKTQGTGGSQSVYSLEEISFIQAVFFVIGSLLFVVGSGLALYVAWKNLGNTSGGPPEINIHE